MKLVLCNSSNKVFIDSNDDNQLNFTNLVRINRPSTSS